MRTLAVGMAALCSSASALNVVDAGVASVSKKLPQQNQDSYFMSVPTYYGVFDGVSSQPESRPYSQTLAKTACEQLNQNPGKKWAEQTVIALTAATKEAAKYKGSSTALLLKLDLKARQPLACVYSLGDCRTLVLRQKKDFFGKADERYSVVEASTDKIHPENGAPYQFGGKKLETDEVIDGQEFNFKVYAGDIILSFSDGIVDNMQPNEIEELVCRNYMESAEELASTLVGAARTRLKVDDDCTAIALKLGDGAPAAAGVQTTPTDGEAIQKAAQGFFKGLGN